MSAPVFVGMTAGTPVSGGSLLRATFQQKSLAVFTSPSTAYKALQTGLPQTNLGYVTSPFVNTPGADSFTSDIRTALAYNKPGGTVAADLSAPALGFELTRLELLGTKQPGYNAPAAASGESASQASENREGQTAAQALKPKWYEALASWLGQSVDTVLQLLKWFAVLAAVLFAAWLYFF